MEQEGSPLKKVVYDFPETGDSLLKYTNSPETTACIVRDSLTDIPKWFEYKRVIKRRLKFCTVMYSEETEIRTK